MHTKHQLPFQQLALEQAAEKTNVVLWPIWRLASVRSTGALCGISGSRGHSARLLQRIQRVCFGGGVLGSVYTENPNCGESQAYLESKKRQRDLESATSEARPPKRDL